MDSRPRKVWFGVVVVVLLVIFVIWPDRRGKIQKAQEAGQGGAIAIETNPVAATSGGGLLEDRIRLLSKDLAAVTNAAGRAGLLRDLRDRLSTMPTNEASVAIRKFLDSQSDAATGQGFKIRHGGTLAEAPTMRTYLLDYLGQIDPAAAAAYAKLIFGGSDSPDEWAVALRNLAIGDTSADGRKLIEDKIRELLHREDWQQNPSSGYLEAFDTAVYLGGTSLTPDLSTLVRKKDNQAVAHAAYLALDRLVIAEPSALLAALQAEPDLMQGREQTRADFFARVDVRDPQQRLVLENYLLDSRIGAAELQQFAGVYPNANFMISANLLTTAPSPKPGDLAARDAESLKVVNEWLADPRFEKLRPQLDRTRARLEEFVKQAQK